MYDSIVYDRTLPIQSYWETTIPPLRFESLTRNQSCDVAIIGAGFTGLSAALHLARSGVEVAVLEAGVPGWGASGRNGGFCCIGATKLSNETLVRRFGLPQTQRFFQEQQQAIELVRRLAAEEQMEIDIQGDGCIQVAHHPSRWQALENEAEFLSAIPGYKCALWPAVELRDRGISHSAYGALHVSVGFGLNPAKYGRALALAAMRQGAKLYAHSPVQTWEKVGDQHVLHSPSSTVKARSIVVATNGYTEDSLHPNLRDRLLPVLSSIITTRPLTEAELAAQGWHCETPVWDTRNLLFYYRLLNDRRFLLGARGGTTGSLAERDRRLRQMRDRFAQIFPGWKDIEITHSWSGLAALSANLTPHINQFPDDSSVFYGLAYHGNGVAMGTWTGRTIAHLITGKTTIDRLCPIVTQPLKQFPLANLRLWYLRSSYLAYQVQDALPW
ncbi:FAD-binding oxidoreductase [Microcoleus sp. FACHB-1515]|uniref:NAD(P)/FAD-dependent oxidoreductase n=1 Tax=Cyanophyceae TaxID=3028117 RepID=UPI00198B4FE8|nr:FAD-dependent oxidoreductase [Microcoleus sp. FACHB-1515]MBD2089355.1 FAD-binding oxidoreductase [Microcoleus sp. FACHB-1515]